jgi:hypothetical protein
VPQHKSIHPGQLKQGPEPYLQNGEKVDFSNVRDEELLGKKRQRRKRKKMNYKDTYFL